MKSLFLYSFFALMNISTYAQPWYNINFENGEYLEQIVRDTISNPNCIWQIGQPAKTVFSSAYSNPNVIVTDTLNLYPINDTSSFLVKHIASFGWAVSCPSVISISGLYSVDSDSLSDYGYISISTDHGITWFYGDSTFQDCYWSVDSIQTIFTGSSNGWRSFNYYIPVPEPFSVIEGDTILYRFTFISDSIQTNKDGLMFDDLLIEDFTESVSEIENDNLISISPNPAVDILSIHRTTAAAKSHLQIVTTNGQLVYDNFNYLGESIDTKQWSNGIYVLKFSDSKNFSVKKFIVQH